MKRQLTAAERYEAKYTRYSLEALNGPMGKRRWNPPRYWWAWPIIGLIVLFFL